MYSFSLFKGNIPPVFIPFHQSSFHQFSIPVLHFSVHFNFFFIPVLFHQSGHLPLVRATSPPLNLSSCQLIKVTYLVILHKQCALSFKHCSFVWLAIAPQCTLYSLVPRPSSLITCGTLWVIKWRWKGLTALQPISYGFVFLETMVEYKTGRRLFLEVFLKICVRLLSRQNKD